MLGALLPRSGPATGVLCYGSPRGRRTALRWDGLDVGEDGFGMMWASRGRHLRDPRLRPDMGVGLLGCKMSTPTFVPDPVSRC